jgi:hypothetical protein
MLMVSARDWIVLLQYSMCARNIDSAAFETVWKYMRRNTAAGLSLSEKNGIPHRLNQDNEMAGRDWQSGFEATSAAGAMAFNEKQV